MNGLASRADLARQMVAIGDAAFCDAAALGAIFHGCKAYLSAGVA